MKDPIDMISSLGSTIQDYGEKYWQYALIGVVLLFVILFILWLRK